MARWTRSVRSSYWLRVTKIFVILAGLLIAAGLVNVVYDAIAH